MSYEKSFQYTVIFENIIILPVVDHLKNHHPEVDRATLLQFGYSTVIVIQVIVSLKNITNYLMLIFCFL